MSFLVALGIALQVGGDPVILHSARVDPRRDVSFHAIARPDTVYVGEAVQYELGVFISDGMRQRLRRNPEFVPPELRSVLAYDIREVVASRSIDIEGRSYEVHVFRRALFPVAAGRITIPPARLTYTVPLGSSFFSREETRTLQSEAVSFVAIPPPIEGRPSTWAGAVGNVTLRAQLTSRAPRVGDPAVVTLSVTGAGNVHLWPRPTLELPWGSVVNGGERVIVDSLARGVRGTKSFDFLVTPTAEGRMIVPPVAYTFFDPAARRYRSVRSRPETLEVAEGELVALDTAVTTPGAPALPALHGEWSAPLPDAPDRNWWYWLLLAIAPMPVVFARVRALVTRRPAQVTEETLDGVSLRRDAPPADVLRILKRAVTRRLSDVTIEWADASAVRRVLRHHGVTDATANATVELLSQLASATYGGESGEVTRGAERAISIYHAIDSEAQRTRAHAQARRRSAVAMLFVMPVALFAPQSEQTARAAFAEGLAAYADEEPALAADAFFNAARAEPGSRAVWTNAGIASWAANDTARAVVAWQRALRLDPLDRTLRDHLAHIGADAGSGNGAVWPIPRRAPAWLALTLWLVAWMQLMRGRRSHWAIASAITGALLAALAFVHGRRLNDPTLAVIAQTTALRMLPALGADAGAAPLTGEIVHVRDRAGVWVYVEATAGREGWIDAARVLNLDGTPLR